MALDGAARRKRAAKALAKQAAGEAKLSRDELRDVEWLETKQRDEIVRAALAALPKGLFCQLAGRQQKVVDEQARRHQLPLLGSTVDLFHAIRKYHDILTNHGDRIIDESSVQSELTREQLGHRRAQRRVLELELQIKQNQLVSREELAAMSAWWQQCLLNFGELLGRKYGAGAQQDLNDLLKKAAAEVRDPKSKIKGVA